jgi:hypothetical protein
MRISQWREDLVEEGYEFAEDMDEEEVVECTCGNELFFDESPRLFQIVVDKMLITTYNNFIKIAINQIFREKKYD